MKSLVFRLLALSLLVASLPLTLINTTDRGLFGDPDGYQGYEIVFIFPFYAVSFGVIAWIPLVISNAYVLVGMWLKRMPRAMHTIAWLMFVPTLLMACSEMQVVCPAFWLLFAAWFFSGIGPQMDYAEKLSVSTQNDRQAMPEHPTHYWRWR